MAQNPTGQKNHQPSPLAQQDSASGDIYRGGEANEFLHLCGERYWAFRAQADQFIDLVSLKGEIGRDPSERPPRRQDPAPEPDEDMDDEY